MPETFKRVEVKVFAPGNRQFTCVTYRPPPGLLYSEVQVRQILDSLMAEVGREFQGADSGYRVVPLGGGRFNVVQGVAEA